MISREMVRFHCQLSGGRKSTFTALNGVLDPAAAVLLTSPALIVSSERKVGSSASVDFASIGLVLTWVVQGGLAASRRRSSITLVRLKKRPSPSRSAVLPSSLRAQATPMRGCSPQL